MLKFLDWKLIATGVVMFFIVQLFWNLLIWRNNKIEDNDREAELIEQWNEKGKECMEEPHASVSHGKFVFECPIREETPEEKAFREVPASYFDFERTGDIDYLLEYLKNNPPTYDCALIDKYWKRGTPCWGFLNALEFNPQEKF